MNETFLENFALAAKKITHAERYLSVGGDMKLQNTNIDQSLLDDPDFGNFAMECLQEAVDSGEAVITNNIITDPEDAPKTNRSFKDLRIVVTMPIPDYGAVYIDQLISNTVIPKEKIDRLMKLVAHMRENQLEHLTTSEMVKLYHELG